jgi:glycosyltransferase involved in cell wall biosynthesis
MSGRRVALVVSRSPQLGAIRFAGLLERGWDAQLVFDHVPPPVLASVPEIRDPAARGRVLFAPAHKPKGRRRADVPRAVLSQLARNRRGLLRWMRAGGRPGLNLLRGHALEAGLIALRPDLIHFDSPASAAEHLRVRELVGARAIVTVTREDLDGAEAAVAARACREADAVHVTGESAWRRLLEAGCPPSKPRIELSMPAVHPDFADSGAGTQPANGDGTLRVLSVAPLTWAQGFEWALQAVALARAAGAPCRYTILGQGEHLEALTFARYQLGLDGLVEIAPGAANRAELKAALREADLYLDAAVAAEAGGAVAEALAMGVPVLATDRTELDGDPLGAGVATVVPRRDAAAMARELASLQRDPEARRRAGNEGREALLRRFTPEDHVARLERGYLEVLGR